MKTYIQTLFLPFGHSFKAKALNKFRLFFDLSQNEIFIDALAEDFKVHLER